ncbi:CLUMA_CG006086, isoform A [Clunio marinus]|uniref:DNA-directed RNA polymerase III subunit RPC9 n=1 Tax=Clunio marinus TaxID=568069 RepID=A0A1J1HWM9_9DIPT|nr:CLUMA_CG006086, isoform A [Clunio marinus]
MEILNPKYQVLSNLEVLMALREIKDQKLSQGARNLATITYETIQYLENTPCKDQSEINLLKFITEVKQFNKLTKSEVLSMVNEPPSLPLHIQLIVEDLEERLTESQVDELIQLSKKYLIPSTHDSRHE